MMNAEFVVVATVDNTVVDITPSRALQGGHAAQQTFSVTLQAGQTYTIDMGLEFVSDKAGVAAIEAEVKDVLGGRATKVDPQPVAKWSAI